MEALALIWLIALVHLSLGVRVVFSAYAGPVVQTFNTITPAPGPLTEEKQAKMREKGLFL